MHILIYSYNYFPEPIGIAPLMTELAEGLAKRGHQVRVVTAFPWYPVSESFPEYDRRRLYLTEYRNGVFIQRCYVRKSRRRNLLNRGIFELSFMLSSFLQAIRRGRPDVILLTVPGLPVGVPASIAGWLFRCPVILNLQDILPDAAIHVGLLTNKVAIRIFSALEKYNYRIATKIAVISEGFIDNLQEKGVPLAKLQLIPNWVDVNFIQPLPKEHNFFREKFNLQGKFIILYAGNMGLTQPMDKVVKAAKLLEQIPDIHFVLVGPESGLEQIQAWRDYTQANNITTASFVSRRRLPELLNMADIGLVVQKRNVVSFNMPSKIQTLLASGCPIVAAVPRHGTAAHAVLKSGGGVWVKPDNSEALAAMIKHLYTHPDYLARLGQQARQHALDNYSFTSALDRYEALFQQVITTSACTPQTAPTIELQTEQEESG